jgi:hypothetical protein
MLPLFGSRKVRSLHISGLRGSAARRRRGEPTGTGSAYASRTKESPASEMPLAAYLMLATRAARRWRSGGINHLPE